MGSCSSAIEPPSGGAKTSRVLPSDTGRSEIRWFRNEYGATPSTLRDYEAVLARMSLTLADKDPSDVSVDDLRDVIDLWGERSPRTRQTVTSIVRAFWSWAEEQGHIPISPGGADQAPAASLTASTPRKAHLRDRVASRSRDRRRVPKLSATPTSTRRSVSTDIATRPTSRSRWTPTPSGSTEQREDGSVPREDEA